MIDIYAPKRKMGVIGRERRFNKGFKGINPGPGPGSYKTELYKSFSKENISALASISYAEATF